MKNKIINSSNDASGALKITYWVTTIIIAIAFFVTGVGNLVPFTHIAHDMTHLGYPSYFLTILGTWKILGAVTIVFVKSPLFKVCAYAGMIFDLTGAAFSRLASGDSGIMIIAPLGIAGLVIISWAFFLQKNSLKTFPG